MKHIEFYTKYKTNYPPLVSPLFSKRNWWRTVLVMIAAVLIGPLIIYKRQRAVHFTFDYYWELVEYFLFITIPFITFLIWTNWRESIKRERGYGWFGKFKVIQKRSSLGFHYLMLAPGDRNKIRVNGTLFEKINVGNFILIRRNSLGGVEDVSKVNNLHTRLNKTGRFQKSAPNDTL